MALDMTPGLVPYPPIERLILNVDKYRIQTNDCRGYDHLHPARPLIPEFLVLHKQQSPPNSTLATADPATKGYFEQACCPALTDFEINAVTGHMKQFVDLGNTDIAGWANGRLSAPYGDALKYIEWKQAQGKWTVSLINIMGAALEIAGYFPTWPVTQDTEVAEVAVANIVQWMAAYAHDYGIAYSDFPIIPTENERSYTTWHQEWTIGTGKVCPGPWVMQRTSAWIDRAAKVMEQYQAATPPAEIPTYAAVTLPDWWLDQIILPRPSDQRFAGATAYVLQRNFRAIESTPRRATPSLSGDPSGPAVKAGEKITAERLWKDPANGRQWFIEDTGHWLLASKFTPRVTIQARG